MASVVIPTKDEEKIFTAIERAKMQHPDEIIVACESSSSQEYKQELKALEVRYFEVEGGTAVARNYGAEKAESDKILFLDADCYPTEGWYEEMSQALDGSDIVEGEVEYIGERCMFNKIVENRGEEGRFLTANLGVRKEVFDEIEFDESYSIFREDTDFGWRATNAGFDSDFVNAKVEHDAGRYSFSSMISDRLRYETEDYFYRKFSGDERIDDEVSKVGPVYYPLELGMASWLLLTLLAGVIFPPALLLALGTPAFLSTYYYRSKREAADAEFCFLDWLRGLYWVPAGLLAKNYAVWKGVIYNSFKASRGELS